MLMASAQLFSAELSRSAPFARNFFPVSSPRCIRVNLCESVAKNCAYRRIPRFRSNTVSRAAFVSLGRW
jgi:hypothetical protein